MSKMICHKAALCEHAADCGHGTPHELKPGICLSPEPCYDFAPGGTRVYCVPAEPEPARAT